MMFYKETTVATDSSNELRDVVQYNASLQRKIGYELV